MQNEDRNTSKMLIVCSDDCTLEIIDEQIRYQSDVILEDSNLFCIFSLSLYEDKLYPFAIDKILSDDFGIARINIMYDDGTTEDLSYIDGEEKSKMLTKVEHIDNLLHIYVGQVEKED